jgi:phage-related holin
MCYSVTGQGCLIFIPKSPSGFNLFVLGMEHVGIFVAIRNILRPFGILFGHLAYFVVILYIFMVLECCTEKNLAALLQAIATTPAFLALVAVHFANNWGLYALLTEIPTYLNNIQHFSLTTVSFQLLFE